MMNLSLKPDPVTRYASCLREVWSLNGALKLFMKFKATHVSEIDNKRISLNNPVMPYSIAIRLFAGLFIEKLL